MARSRDRFFRLIPAAGPLRPIRTLSPAPFRPGPALARLAGIAALAGLLAGCAPGDGDQAATGVYRLLNSQRNPPLELLEHTVEYAVVPPTRAFVHAPQALLVTERRLDRALEQRIFLPNGTAIPGDNILHLRAQSDRSARTGEFSFDEVNARFGGMPEPFRALQPGSLTSGQDALGSYVYARRDLGTDTVCVLVMRRIPAAARPLPQGIQSLDVMMRNCVVGTVEMALAPMRDRAMATPSAPQGTIYTQSPFAAPLR